MASVKSAKVLNVDALTRGYTRGRTRNTSPVNSRTPQPAVTPTPSRPKTPKGAKKGRRKKSSARSKSVAPRSASLIERLRIERRDRIRQTVNSHSEEEVRDFLIQILDKLPGVILDLNSYPHLDTTSYKRPTTTGFHSPHGTDQTSPDEPDGGFAQNSTHRETNFVDKLCSVLKEYKSIDI